MEPHDSLNLDNWDVSEGDTRSLPGGLLLTQQQTNVVQLDGPVVGGWWTGISRLGGPCLWSHISLTKAEGETLALKWLAAWRVANQQ
jgi:hypothetical protein